MKAIIEEINLLRRYLTSDDNLYDILHKAADTIEDLHNRIIELENRDMQYDKVMRVNIYLVEKFGQGLWDEFEIERTGDKVEEMLKMMSVFDKIYEIEKEKYPNMWYEYCLCADSDRGDGNENKG